MKLREKSDLGNKSLLLLWFLVGIANTSGYSEHVLELFINFLPPTPPLALPFIRNWETILNCSVLAFLSNRTFNTFRGFLFSYKREIKISCNSIRYCVENYQQSESNHKTNISRYIYIRDVSVLRVFSNSLIIHLDTWFCLLKNTSMM